MNRFTILSLILTALFFYACNNPQPEAYKLLNNATRLVEVYPDSAMIFIDSIFYPEKSLNRENYMRFLVVHVQAKYKTYRPIQEDTLIFKASEYFSNKKNDSYQTAIAYFYSGCVYREQKEYKKAIQQYTEAQKYALQTNDMKLNGLIQYNTGDLLVSQGLFLKAVDYYKEAANYYAQSPLDDYDKQAISFSAIGRMFMLSGNNDSAFHYFNKGLQVTNFNNDNKSQSLIYQNISILYRESKQYEEAEIHLRQSFELNTDSTEIPRYLLNFARLYKYKEQHDSLILYTSLLNQSINSIDNNALKASVYEFLALYEKERGSYHAAFDYKKKYTDVLIDIMDERNRQSLYEVQQKYNFEIQQTQFDKHYTKTERYILNLIIVVLIGTLIFTIYTFKQRKKHIIALQRINILRNMADNLEHLHNTNETILKNKMRDLIINKIDIIKRVMLLNNSIKENDSTKRVLNKINTIVYGEDFEEDWLVVLDVYNEINPGFYEDIQKRYNNFTKNEFRVFILSHTKFTPKEISVVLNLTYNTVLTIRSSIRKKIKMNGSRLNDLLYI